jgi:hypothetical protein
MALVSALGMNGVMPCSPHRLIRSEPLDYDDGEE